MSDPKHLDLVECFPWCEYGDGHPNLTSRDDQWCGTPIREVPTIAYPANKMTDGTWKTESVWVSGRAWHHQGRVSIIEIALSEGQGLEVTAAEAREIAARILEVADEMEQP